MSKFFELSPPVVEALNEVPRYKNHLSSRSSEERIVRFLAAEYLEAQESKEGGSEELSEVESYQHDLRESMGLPSAKEESSPDTEGMSEAQAKRAELREQLDLDGPSDEAELSDENLSPVEKEQRRLKKEILD
ncbi:hypothetical protein [Halococcus salsus]|uniref:hypothetical protein n=1 Tax=Halococcus salsus TaxID=2162894 RepID=UPI001358D64C|nr:hypothetical protein [Halococcus salsus]